MKILKVALKWQRFVSMSPNWGLPFAIAVNVILWVFSYYLVDQCHDLLFRLHWVKTRSSITLEDFGVAVFTGIAVGLVEFACNMHERDKARQVDRTETPAATESS